MVKLFIVTALFYFSFNPVWINNLDTAKSKARSEKKLILLNFSGSDWCIPCIHLRQDVFDTDVFTKYASEHLVLVNADFPRKKNNQLSSEQQELNNELADKYNPDGSFPFTLLLDSDGNKIKIWDGYYKNGPEDFVREIQSIIESN